MWLGGDRDGADVRCRVTLYGLSESVGDSQAYPRDYLNMLRQSL